MAKLKLIPTPSDEDVEYLPSSGSVPPEDASFIEFRKKFYHYYHEFISRAKNVPSAKDKLLLYKQLSTGVCDSSKYGMSNDNDTYMKRYTIRMTIDYKLSLPATKKHFDNSCAELWDNIVSMYNDFRVNNIEYITDYPRTADNRIADIKRLFTVWDKSLSVYDIYEKQEVKNKAQVSREMGWFHKDASNKCSDEINRYLKYATKFIEASCRGTLFEEACKPMIDRNK